MNAHAGFTVDFIAVENPGRNYTWTNAESVDAIINPSDYGQANAWLIHGVQEVPCRGRVLVGQAMLRARSRCYKTLPLVVVWYTLRWLTGVDWPRLPFHAARLPCARADNALGNAVSMMRILDLSKLLAILPSAFDWSDIPLAVRDVGISHGRSVVGFPTSAVAVSRALHVHCRCGEKSASRPLPLP